MAEIALHTIRGMAIMALASATVAILYNDVSAVAQGNVNRSESGIVSVAPGYFTKSPNPGCIGEKSADPSAHCERVCTTIPAGVRIKEVMYFLKETDDSELARVKPGTEALPWAKFEPYTMDKFKDVQEVCARVMNWSGDREREAQIVVIYHQ